MDRMIYLSMAGAKMNMQRQEVLSHNLANVSTTGFRAELQAVRAVPVRGDGASTRVYALDTTVGYDDSAGPVNFTGRALDVAMRGKAMLTVQGLDGTEAYTRAGSLAVDSQGNLLTQSGLPVMGDGGPINLPPDTKVNIAPDGTVSVRQQDGNVTPVGRLKLVTPEAKLVRGDDGLFRSPDGDLPADATAQLQDGALEGSNVNPIETMVSMITAARQFEAQIKMMQTAEQDEKAAAQLLSNAG
ncbi:MAG: flagellar basal-body rod protein FlgF [Aquabacterium sp.]|jgi:flagellar basal-body rod protein FlgF|uniref:flagellar basal-body rod protein FlgF n=1 Tax=Aquabacterium sp. TaxID=1872578 RepID=UPI001B4C92A1|nr:flagellar basal-body rod protein FlgF [Aquabacterium sp.]MBP7132837.1 flagellar basal-body rod protein FlgF [Aquabacterium sp.]MBP9062898.1 flagellar basal-body rod protein FlgF [Aquabacterium sp.]MDQ5927151.1 flagellar basal-body rod protein FlgF [Pseudomonadota bacterium]